jgi:hypothetical protein
LIGSLRHYLSIGCLGRACRTLALAGSALCSFFFMYCWRPFHAFWLLWSRTPEPVAAVALSAVPDLRRDDPLGNELPEEGWLKLARELLEQGAPRLALRALYLAGLAHLGRRELVRIARFKSNREYQLELRRRWPARSELHAAFGEAVGTFERVWYGREEVQPELLTAFESTLERITQC